MNWTIWQLIGLLAGLVILMLGICYVWMRWVKDGKAK